jgi:glycosyltransferase involved in cell wall biosynthesis
LLVNPKDPKEFADAMLKILKDDSLRDKLGKEANRLILDEYSWEAMAQKHINFYKNYYDNFNL